MKRREFIALLSSATAAGCSFAARAQQNGKITRIGFFGASLNSSGMAEQYATFLAKLREQGFSEGKDVIIDYKRNDDPRGPFASAAELMRSQVDLVVATGPESVLQAVIGASRSIPVVFLAVQYDPIARGYVNSLAHPGGNVTGIFYRAPELAAKQLEILVQTFPERSRLAVLYDANSAEQFSAAEVLAKSMPLQIRPLKLEKLPYDFGAAFQTLANDGAQMVLILSSPFFVEYHKELAAEAIKHRLPTMFVFKGYVQDGGLMSYGVEQLATYRRIADFVAKILKGAKPADLPVEQPTKFEFVVNLKTAGAIGIELPTGALLRTDEVIE